MRVIKSIFILNLIIIEIKEIFTLDEKSHVGI